MSWASVAPLVSHGLLNVLALGRTLSRHAFKVPTILELWVKHKHSYGEYSDHAMRNFVDNFKQTFGLIRRRMAPVEVDEAAPALFAQCRFALVCGEDLSTAAAQKLATTLKLHGGEILTDKYDGESLPLEDLTHIICGSSDFPSYDAASGALIPAIKPHWVDVSLAKSKLANPRQYSSDPRLFMSDVVICCADLPEGDRDAIIGGVLAMGGLYSAKVSSMVTHVVALTMDSDICRNVALRKLDMKIVLPHWFDDCLKLGRRIEETPYLLPEPEILRPVNGLPPKAAENGFLNGAVDPDPARMPSSSIPRSPRGPLQVFAKRKVMLGPDLGIGSHLKDVLKALIGESKGQLTNDARNADMLICRYREGSDYRLASQAGKDVGNLAWLYYLITNNSWTSPMRRLLHYPVARNGVPGFQGLRISLSNYSGEARLYLENLVVAAGAECTKTLKQDNTHLITAHIMSEKCAAAKDWGVHIINHLWLEESYAKWKIQSITNSRYTHFPRRTNLGEVVGQTKIDRHALELYFYYTEDTEMEEVAQQLHAMQPKEPNVALNSASSLLNSPTTPHMRYMPGRSVTHNDATPRAVQGSERIAEPSKLRTPAAGRIVNNGKENQTPSTSSSRKSKDAAAARLHDIVSDIALYEKEKKRVGGVIYGGRRKTDAGRVLADRKRSIAEDLDSDATERGDSKRVRTDTTSTSMRLLVSGYKKWIGQPKVEDADKKRLRNLGIIVTQEPSRASHLAAPCILRTHKFISAMAYAPTIISTEYIDKCLENDELLHPEPFLLQDKANERRFHISLAQSQKRAKENRNKLFQGRTIYCVEHIHGGFDTYKSIVEANGGRCNMYRGRQGTMVPSRRADSETTTTEDEGQAEVFLISGQDKDQERVWSRFRQMAEGSRKIPRIVRSEWLLESAMAQQILPVGNHELR